MPSPAGQFPGARRPRRPHINLDQIDAEAAAENEAKGTVAAKKRASLEERQAAADAKFLPPAPDPAVVRRKREQAASGSRAFGTGSGKPPSETDLAEQARRDAAKADDRPERDPAAKPPEIEQEQPPASEAPAADWPDETPEPPAGEQPAPKSSEKPATKAAKKAATKKAARKTPRKSKL